MKTLAIVATVTKNTRLKNCMKTEIDMRQSAMSRFQILLNRNSYRKSKKPGVGLIYRKAYDRVDFPSRKGASLRFLDSRMALVISNDMPKIRSLRITFNPVLRWPRLTSLPSEFGQCDTLHLLDLSDQDLSMIPQCILKMRRLRILMLCNNRRLKMLPADMDVRLPKLMAVLVGGTGISNVTSSVRATIVTSDDQLNRMVLFHMERHDSMDLLESTKREMRGNGFLVG